MVLGSAFIDTGIGTGGWLLATIPLAPFIFAASYFVVWAIQLLGDGLGPTKTSAGILTLTAVMILPRQTGLLVLIGSPLVYFGFCHGIQYILRRLAEAE